MDAAVRARAPAGGGGRGDGVPRALRRASRAAGAGRGTGAPAADLAAWITDHRVLLLAGELALGVALLAVIVVSAPLVVVIRGDGNVVTAVAFSLVLAAFIGMCLSSLTPQTALFAAEPADDTRLAVLDSLQPRVRTC
ncbi:hypothetical protein GCM10010932_16000 [Agromyces flavus]|nr:hypothetical protein GCM10010932_16000 [Agromyces flavus]